jgi:hypothetical protein
LKSAIKAINTKEYSIGHPPVSLFWYHIDTKQGDFSMKGGNMMNQQEFCEAIRKSEEIRAQAMQMAEESIALMDTDFKKSMDMFLEAMDLLSKGTKIAQRAINEAIDSGMLTLTEDQEKKLCEIYSKK